MDTRRRDTMMTITMVSFDDCFLNLNVSLPGHGDGYGKEGHHHDDHHQGR